MGLAARAVTGPTRGNENARRHRRTVWQWVRDIAFTLGIALGIGLLAVPVNLYFRWRRYLLRREIRERWGSRPRVIVRVEGTSWSKVLNERWLPSATERTLVLDTAPTSADGRAPWPLEWRVY